jgi:hypothetical protein
VVYNGIMATPPSNPCPKCGRSLQATGELLVADLIVPVYQCDQCLVPVDFAGEPMDVALTFAVNAAGQAFDPADPDGTFHF